MTLTWLFAVSLTLVVAAGHGTPAVAGTPEPSDTTPAGLSGFDSIAVPLDIDGLRQRTISSITQDANGFMWFASGSGLARWDGVNLVMYGTGDGSPVALPALQINDLTADAEGGIWAAGESIMHLHGPTGPIDVARRSSERIVVDGTRVWSVGPSGTLTAIEDRGRLGIARGRTASLTAVNDALALDDGSVVVASGTGVLWYAPNSEPIAMFAGGEDIVALASIRDPESGSESVIGVSSSSWWSFGADRAPTPLLADLVATALISIEASDTREPLTSQLFAGDARGRLHAITIDGDRVTVDESIRAVPDEPIRDLLVADDGSIWIVAGGAVWTLPSRVPSINEYQLPARDRVAALDAVGDSVWVVGESGSIYRLDAAASGHLGSWSVVVDEVFEELEFRDFGDDSTSVLDVAVDDAGGRVWIATTTGLYLYLHRDDRLGPRLVGVNSVGDEPITAVRAAPDGGVFVAPESGGLFRLIDGERSDRLTRSGIDATVRALRVSGDSLWVGSDIGVFEIADPSGLDARQVAAGEVFDLLVRGDDVVAVTLTGLELIDRTSGAIEELATGLDVIGGPASRLLGPSSEAGAPYVVSPRAAAVIDIDRSSGFVLVDEPDDPIVTSDVLDDGSLVYGSGERVVTVDAGDAYDVELLRRIAITDIVVNGESVPVGDELKVDRSDSIQVRFTVPMPRDTDLIAYEYRLEGTETSWVPVGHTGSITLANLQSGRYRLELRAHNVGGLGNREIGGPTFSLEVTRPWWNAPAVYYGLAVLVALAMWAFVARRSRLASQRTRDLEETVAERTMLLAESAQVAERANESMSNFLAAVSHDLRSPLNAVLGFTELIVNEASADDVRDTDTDAPDDPAGRGADAPIRHWAETAHEAGSRLAEMIESLLVVAQSGAESAQGEPQTVHLRRLVGALGEMVEAAGESGEYRLIRTRISNEIGEYYALDPSTLRRVLTNLLENAMTHGQGLGVLLSVDLARREPDGDVVRFAVTDHGPGIPPDEIDTVFQPFTRGSAAIVSGHGLGLSLCAQLAQQMRSELRVESAIGGPTRFWFDVELRPADVAVGTGSEASSSVGSLIVVDDEELSRRVVIDILSVSGFSVRAYATGSEALDAARAERPIAVVTDYLMAEMNGRELAIELRAMFGRDLPILVVTAVADLITDTSPFDAVLSKPVRQGTLTNAVQACLDRVPG